MKKSIMCLIMLVAFIAVGATTISNPVYDLSRSVVEEDCKKDLLEKWGNDPKMLNVLLKTRMKSYTYLASQPGSKVSDEIMTRLIRDWYPEMNLIELFYDIEMKQYRDQ